MVLNEIFISNPTRPKRSFYKARVPLVIALGLGLFAGLIAGGIITNSVFAVYFDSYSYRQVVRLVVDWCFL